VVLEAIPIQLGQLLLHQVSAVITQAVAVAVTQLIIFLQVTLF
jgi:hypothetical protein